MGANTLVCSPLFCRGRELTVEKAHEIFEYVIDKYS